MIEGSYLLMIASVAALLSLVGNYFVARGKNDYLLASRWSYYLMTVLVLVSTVYLAILFLTDHFEYAYVSGYSSLDLPFNFKITSLWAGQEGSFLIWLAISVLLGLWVKAKAGNRSGWVMFFYILGQIFLLVLLNISSPFKLNSVVPVDGQGLNPLLRNFWMQIHPPIVFLGYASTFVPFSFAMAALATNEYDNWVKMTFPWVIFSVFSLGTGIFIGGYWAYETLGWGGYWGWDPVENASLVPWLGSVALVHGMILERFKGTFRKTNIFLAITVFLMVIYGTFLTRSGVLADFSVHSFFDLGYNVYLVLFLVMFTVVSYGLLAYKSRSIKSSEPSRLILSREFVVYLGMFFIILSAFLVLLGTSAPLLTRIFGEPSTVDQSYYIITNLPIGIILGVVLGLAAILSWRKSAWFDFRYKLILSITISLLMTLINFLLGVDNLFYLIFIFTSGFAFVANLIFVVKGAKKGLFHILPGLVHAGFALMFIGVVVSSVYSVGQKVSIEEGKTEDILGYDIKFKGSEQITHDKQKINIEIARGSAMFSVSPVFIWSRYGLVRNPCIKRFLLYDLYISPEEIKIKSPDDMREILILAKNQTGKVKGYEVTFKQFDLGSHVNDEAMIVGAVLEVRTEDGKNEIIKPTQVVRGNEEPKLIPAEIQSTGDYIYLLKIKADEGLVKLGVSDKETPADFEPRQTLIIHVSIKPLINLVWLGLIMMIIGSAIVTYRRITEIG